MVKNLWKLSLFTLFLGLLAGPRAMGVDDKGFIAQHPRRGLSVPISLPNLVRGSQRIFLGVLGAVGPTGKTTPPNETFFQFKVLSSLKGKVSTATILELRQSNRLTSSVAVGEKVIWFLPKDSPDGYSVPLGFNSGDFRVDANGVAVNLNRNRGLWADDASLWDTDECSRDRFFTFLRTFTVPNSTLLTYLRRADNPYVAGPLPFEFLYSAVLSCLDDSDFLAYLKEQPSDKVPEIVTGG